MTVELPTLILVAHESAEPLDQLFGKRGFQTHRAADTTALQRLLGPPISIVPAAAILDYEVPDAEVALQLLLQLPTPPVVVGIAALEGPMIGQELLDSAFRRPVDPARLFARIVQLLAERKKGRPGARKRLTGVVAVVRGNALFHRVEQELHGAVPKVNAPAILEKALLDLGTSPASLTPSDLRRLVETGALAQALEDFGEPARIVDALKRIAQIQA